MTGLALHGDAGDLLAGRDVISTVGYAQENLFQGGHAQPVAETREGGDGGDVRGEEAAI